MIKGENVSSSFIVLPLFVMNGWQIDWCYISKNGPILRIALNQSVYLNDHQGDIVFGSLSMCKVT